MNAKQHFDSAPKFLKEEIHKQAVLVGQLLNEEKKWVKGVMFRAEDGRLIDDVTDERIWRMCLLGATYMAGWRERDIYNAESASVFLDQIFLTAVRHRHGSNWDVPRWNDAASTSYADVRSIVDEVIESTK